MKGKRIKLLSITKRLICITVVFVLTTISCLAIEYDSSIYPRRISQNQIEYSPWFTLCGIAAPQTLQGGVYAGENCQVVSTIAFSDVNPDHVIAGFDTNTVAITTDGGENWFYANTDKGTHGCQSAIWHPTDPNTVYRASSAYNESKRRSTLLSLADNRGLLRSRDCGRTWEIILPIAMPGSYSTGRLMAFDESGAMYALTVEGVMKSYDDGDTWENLSNIQCYMLYDMCVSSDGMTILTATAHGIHASFDGGKTWELRNGRQHYGNASAIDIDPRNENHWIACFEAPYYGFVESFDKGKTWYGIECTELQRPEKIIFSGILDDGSCKIYAVGESGAYSFRVSSNGGKTWMLPQVSVANGKANHGSQREGIGLSKKHPEIIWYAFGDTLHCSKDAGVHFESKGYGHGGFKAFYTIHTDKYGRLHMPGTDTGYQRTIDPYVSGGEFPTFAPNERIYGSALDISPFNDELIIFGGGNYQGTMVLYKSENLGEEWQILDDTYSDTGYSLVDFHDNVRGMVYTNSHTSYDNGNTWHKNEVNISAVSPVNNDVLYSKTVTEVGKEGFVTNILQSKDRGKTWKEYLNIKGNFNIITDIFDENTLWLYDERNSRMFDTAGILYKFDGTDMISIYDFDNLVDTEVLLIYFARDPLDKEHMLVSLNRDNMDMGYGIAESFDGGKTWMVVPDMPGDRWIQMIFFEEKTNDIFINGYCGLFLYDSEAFKTYLSKK